MDVERSSTDANWWLLSVVNDSWASASSESSYPPPSADADVLSGLEDLEDGEADWLLTLTLVVKTCLMGLIIAASIFGNLLVIISVARFRKLRIITNYFVVSLAMADILVALVAMGFNASVIIFGRWMFGAAMCDIWNSFDVYFCTVSILHLCCISVDRYYAISQPLMYPMKITRKKVAVMLANIWTWPALISYLPIFLGWYTTDEHSKFREEHPDRCVFVVNKVYAVISSSISFWIPCAIMLFTYYRIYEMASRQEKMLLKTVDAAMVFRQQNQRRSDEMEQHQIHHMNNCVATTGSAAPATTNNTAVVDSNRQANLTVPTIQVTKPDVLPEVNGGLPKVNTAETSLHQLSTGQSESLQDHQQDDSNKRNNTQQQQSQQLAPCSAATRPRPSVSAGDQSSLLLLDHHNNGETPSSSSSKDKHLQKIRREHKAARTLGIIMGAFVLCWLPFFIWYLSITLCGEACYCPDIVVEVLFWIGYFNSTLNPLIYAYFNKDFREAFRNTLICVFCTRCQDPRTLARDQQNANYANMARIGGGNNQLGNSGEHVYTSRIRHSSGDTIAGIERIDHKRLSGVAVQNL